MLKQQRPKLNIFNLQDRLAQSFKRNELENSLAIILVFNKTWKLEELQMTDSKDNLMCQYIYIFLFKY